MKKLFKLISVILLIVIVSGCKKIDKISYTQYNEYFSSKDGYTILDQTDKFDIDVRRYLEAGNGDIQVFYIEFANKKYVEDYINNTYAKDSNYKVKNKTNYTYVKSTKNRYTKMYAVDNTILLATTNNKKYKRQINRVLKDLGY